MFKVVEIKTIYRKNLTTGAEEQVKIQSDGYVRGRDLNGRECPVSTYPLEEVWRMPNHLRVRTRGYLWSWQPTEDKKEKP